MLKISALILTSLFAGEAALACSRLPIHASVEEAQAVVKSLLADPTVGSNELRELSRVGNGKIVVTLMRDQDTNDMREYEVTWIDDKDDGIACAHPKAKRTK